ncbi:hypothetical protein U1Q18_038401, partial [Sarracenia purpurea var. burkii]
MEKINIKSFSSQAKILGTTLAISGALVVTLYKGPSILSGAPSPANLTDKFLVLDQSKWVLGAAFLTVSYFFSACGNIVQGIYITVLMDNVIAWCLLEKGPLYVVMFRPLVIAIAQVMGVIFLRETLYLGRQPRRKTLLPRKFVKWNHQWITPLSCTIVQVWQTTQYDSVLLNFLSHG